MAAKNLHEIYLQKNKQSIMNSKILNNKEYIKTIIDIFYNCLCHCS